MEMRNGQIVLNIAVGKADEMATLYDFPGEGLATLEPAIKDYRQDKQKQVVTKKTIVPQLSMKQICERYFVKKPNVLNLDIEGLGARALMGNDWSNPKCIPDFIIIEDNVLNEISGDPSIKEILTKNGYNTLGGMVNENSFYVKK